MNYDPLFPNNGTNREEEPYAETPPADLSPEEVPYEAPVENNNDHFPMPEPPVTEEKPRMQQEPRTQQEPYYGRAPYEPPMGGPGTGRQPYYSNPYYGYPPQEPPRNGYGPRTSYGSAYPYTGTPYGAVPPSPPREPEPKPKKKANHWFLILLIAGCVLIGTLSGILIAGMVGGDEEEELSRPSVTQPTQDSGREPTEPSTLPPRETQPLATANGEQMTLNQIYTANVPAIVSITNEYTQTLFGQSATAASAGSGFIITSDGEILTNYHVVEGAERLTVTLYDGKEYPATLVGYEAESDVALIKIDAQGLPVCAIGDSDRVFVGEQIAAIGNPMGELNYTMTVGYVSAMDRFVNTDGTPINMIQVDAAINPGNSGGPVFNLYGEVIGIATAKYSGTLSGGATLEGLGFAIPINDVTEILNDLRVNGKVPDRAYMGVMVSMAPLDEATYGIDHGVFVQSVDEGGSAYKAGIQANDIILKIGDEELNAYENLQQTLRKYRAGDETTITVYRNGEILTMPIVFDAKPETTEPVTEVPTETPTEPEATEFPWEDFPWEDFPWGDFGG